MSDIADRIKELIDSKRLSNSEFAKETDLNPAIISHILSGRNKASLQVISQIKNTFTNVNLDYLITGQGELFNDLTNVKKDEREEFGTTAQASSGFPMEGVRMASVPGFPQTEKQPSDDTPSPTPETSSEPADEGEKAETKPSKSGSADNIERQSNASNIEQIVIFYKDGSFKAYRP